MPKKFINENTKAVAAKDRKEKVKQEATLKKHIESEEEKWKDESKLLQKKLKKLELEDKKREEHIKRKAELKELLKNESESITKEKTKNVPKVTRAQINPSVKTQKLATKNANVVNKNGIHLTGSLTKNMNHLTLNEETARTINEAIAILNNDKDVVDRHPEKRLKAAHKSFEERRLKELKIANPTLKLSQLKQIVFKEWQKMQDGSA